MAFGLTPSGKVRPMAWRVSSKVGLPGITLSTATAKMEPSDLTLLLDPGHAARIASLAVRGAGGTKQGGVGWKDLWAPTAAWSTDVTSTVALGECMNHRVQGSD